MKLLLARHGNTFSPGEVPVFVGSKDDMALVDEGYRQAERFAELLKIRKIKPDAIYCGPLQRTRKFAELVAASLRLELPLIIDERLNELDYGGWNGKSNDEIIAQFGRSVFDEWNDASVWPTNSEWPSSPEELSDQVRSFIADLKNQYSADKTVFVVTSNGRMRYFLKLIDGAFEQRQKDHTLKVAPGNFCQMTFNDAEATVHSWNEPPTKLLKSLEG
jgi:broad specificity phosphatase PhoE